MSTDTAYQARFAQLRARYERAHGCWDWSDFIDWLIARRPSLRPASYRQYRAAVVWALQQQGGPQAGGLCARLRCEGQAARRRELALRTSAGKAKSVPLHDLHRLVVKLQTLGGKWDDLTARWLFWSTQTGLRPVEWRDVALREHATGVDLLVRNAKHSHGRAHGELRTVHLQMDDDAQQAVQALRTFVGRVQADFAAAYQGCRLALHRATRALWPHRQRHPTLYTGRHQFAADAKASGLPPEAIAALMGHAVTDTHQTHYGKRRCGRGGLLAAADPGDVRRVQERMQAKAQAVACWSESPSPGLGE
jgi:hypothetical protein